MLKSFMQPGTGSPSRTEPSRNSHAAYASTRTNDTPTGDTSKRSEGPKDNASPGTPPVARNDEGSKLIVGPNIKLKGSEITDCEILVVEGRVEASMNSRDIRIAEGGVFSGKAEIDVAEVRGTFEGELTARKRLVVYASGRLTGTIRYGALMVEEGATIAGNIAAHTADPNLGSVPDAPARPARSEKEDDTAGGAKETSESSVFSRSQRRHG